MKNLFYSAVMFFSLSNLIAQSPLKDIKVGHIYNISTPTSYSKTVELVEGSSYQFMDTIQNAYGYVIDESKEDVALSGTNIKNAKDYFDFVMSDFLVDLKKRKIGTAKTQVINGNTYIQNECSYFDEEDNASYFYYVTVVETKTHFYYFVGYTDESSKDKLKDTFFKIGLSIREI